MSESTEHREEQEEAPFDFLDIALRDMLDEDLLTGLHRGPAAVRIADGGNVEVADVAVLENEGHASTGPSPPTPPTYLDLDHHYYHNSNQGYLPASSVAQDDAGLVPIHQRREGWLFSSSSSGSTQVERPSFSIRRVVRDGREVLLPTYPDAEGNLEGAPPGSVDSDASAIDRAFPIDPRLPVLSQDDVEGGLAEWLGNLPLQASPAEVPRGNGEEYNVIHLPEIPGVDPLHDLLQNLNIVEVPWDDIQVDNDLGIHLPDMSPPSAASTPVNESPLYSPGPESPLRSPIHFVVDGTDRVISPPPRNPDVWFVSSIPSSNEDPPEEPEDQEESESERSADSSWG